MEHCQLYICGLEDSYWGHCEVQEQDFFLSCLLPNYMFLPSEEEEYRVLSQAGHLDLPRSRTYLASAHRD